MDIRNLKFPKLDYKSIIIWTVLLVGGYKFLTIGIGHETLWYDESYSAGVIKHSIPQIWSIVSGDVHPPLYYIMLKIFTVIFGTSEGALRLLSVLGVLALAALGAGPVRRVFDKFTGMIYGFIVIIVPISLSMGQEARMYTWAAFFVTAAALYGYLAADKGKLSDFIKLGVFSVAAAYTHYYALMAVTIANALLFIYLIVRFISKKEKKEFFTYLAVASGAVLVYTPWIAALLSQVSRTSKDFWITEVTSQVIWGALILPFSAKFWTLATSHASFVGAAALILWGMVTAAVKRRKEGFMSLFAVLVYSLTFVGGLVISEMIRPMFVERYILVVSGLFLLAFAYGISTFKSKASVYLTCIVLLVVSLPLTGLIVSKNFNGPMKEVMEYVNGSIESDDIFLHTDEHTFGMFSYYYPDHKHYLYLKPGFSGYSTYKAFDHNGRAGADADQFLKESDNIWLVTREGGMAPYPPFEWYMSGKIKSDEPTQWFKNAYSYFVISVRKVHPGKGNEEALRGTGDIKFQLYGMNGKPGQVYVKLFNKDVPFFDESGFIEENVFMSKSVDGDGALNGEVVFEDLPFGVYAAFVIHDLNDNGKLDFRENWRPTEGVGISNGFRSRNDTPSFKLGSFILDFKEIEKDIFIFYP